MPNTKISVKEGKIQDLEGFNKALSFLFDGDYLVPFVPLAKPKDIEEWRRLYFALRDIVYEDGGTGKTKKELHWEAKYILLLEMLSEEEKDCFNVDLDKVAHCSTSFLSEYGWEIYVKRYKEFALENYNCFL